IMADDDTIVFILSPASAKSPICTWEVDYADSLSKRIIPVLAQQLGDMSAPPKLAALNYVHFEEGHSLIAGLKALAHALNADLDWLREHTRRLARAMEWDKGGRASNRLLSGADVASAKAWAARRPKDAPAPTALHLDFIRTSEQVEAERHSAERRRLEEMAHAQAAREEA